MKKDGIVKLVSILIGVFVVIFVGYHVFRHFYSSYSTESAYRYTVYNAVSTEGILIRKEEALTQNVSGYLRYLVEDGEKVKSGTAIASSFASQSEANRVNNDTRLSDELGRLQALQRRAQTNNASDITSVSNDIDEALGSFSCAVMTNDYSKLEGLTLSVEEKINLKAMITGGENSVNDRIAALQGMVAQSNGGSRITSSGVGYFSHCVDGYETTYSTNMIGNISADDLSGMIGKDYAIQQNSLGKLVLEDGWYYVASIPADRAEDFAEGSKVLLHFSGSSNAPAEATVYKVEPQEGKGIAVITFYSTAVNSDTVSRRKAKVEVTSLAYVGIRFNSDLLHIVDGVKGVYVDAGYTVKFKKVDIVYAGKGFYLSKLNYTGEETLNIFDKLIISNANLYDGMPLSDL